VLSSKRTLQLYSSSFVLLYTLAWPNSFEYTGHTESPFVERWHPATAAPEETKPVLELHAVSVENGIPWLTFYDSAGKRWLTGKPGDVVGAYKIASFDLESGNVSLSSGGKIVTIVYSVGKLSLAQSSSKVDLVSAESQAPKAAPLSSSESVRLEQVASMIRQQIELQKRQASHAGS